MHSSFGARLRAQREKHDISLAEIARQTKIKVSLLEALERDNLTWWPHGIFGRAYIRSYAKAIGVESESLIREFLELHPDPPDYFAIAEAQHAAGLSSAIRSAVGAIPGLRRRREAVEGAPIDARATEPGPVDIRPHEEATPLETRPAETRAVEPPQLGALARLCAELQQLDDIDELRPVLGSIARLLDASGLVLWLWDGTMAALRPWMAHGYPHQVVAQLPLVRREDDNAIAAAFRAAETCVVEKGTGPTGAIVVPLVGGSRCVGALALELRNGGEQEMAVRDVAVIVAALLVRFADAPVPLAAVASM